jgi:cytochrome bd-type quinol oxidase subunit 2
MNETMDIKIKIGKSFQYAAVGFAISVVVIGLIAIYHFTFHEVHPIDRQNDLSRLPQIMLIPSVILGLLFGLSKFASSSHYRGLTLIRSLTVIVGAITIVFFSIRPRVHSKTVDPDAWLETAIPVATALITTIAVLIYNHRLRAKAANHEIPKNKLTPDVEITNG